MYCDICNEKLENGENVTECPGCFCNITERKSLIPYGGVIKKISKDENFMNAMIELHKNDPIEFQLKIEQFKSEIQKRKQLQQQSQQRKAEKDVLKCPICNSTSITSGTRGFSLIGGFLGSGSPRNICQNCGHKWKPGGGW